MEAEDTKGTPLLSCVSWVPHPPPTGPGQEDEGEALLAPLRRPPPGGPERYPLRAPRVPQCLVHLPKPIRHLRGTASSRPTASMHIGVAT